MTEPTDHQRSTVIYFLVSALIGVVGIVLTVWGAFDSEDGGTRPAVLISMGTSLLAAGLASLGFGVLRRFDDRDAQALERDIQGLGVDVRQYSADAASSIRVTSVASLRCVPDSEIGAKFRTEYARFARRDGTISVDVLGLKLYRFLDDQLEWMLARKQHTHVRLLLQNPDTTTFAEICELEGRDQKPTREDLHRTTNMLVDATTEGQSLVWRTGLIEIELRYFSGYQPVTLFRVDGSLYVRPRVRTPLGPASRFYEVYEKRDTGTHFAVHARHFHESWLQAHYGMTKSDSDSDSATST